MEKPKYTRIRDRIIHPDGRVEKFPSIGQAKKRSLQLSKSGQIVSVDRSEDPKPAKLNFGHSPGGKRRFYVSRAEEKRIETFNKREAQKRIKQSFEHVVEKFQKVVS